MELYLIIFRDKSEPAMYCTVFCYWSEANVEGPGTSGTNMICWHPKKKQIRNIGIPRGADLGMKRQ
jgi:hypothetical protein